MTKALDTFRSGRPHVAQIIGKFWPSSLIFLLLLSSPSYAAVYHYRYEGNPQVCDIDDDWCLDFGAEGLVFEGGIAINEDLFPGGSIAGATLEMESELLEDGPFFTWEYRLSYTVKNSGNEFSGRSLRGGSRQIFPFLRSLDGRGSGGEIVLDTLTAQVTGQSFYSLSFGPDRQITSWSGDSGLAGGSNDYFTNSRLGDGTAGGTFAPPGEWRLTYVGPAPVPLPASLPLLGAALAGLWSLGRRRQRRLHAQQN